jgi:hypothetical protein
VLAHLRAHPRLDFSPRELARVLGRSHGAISTACKHLVADGQARCTSSKPQRYQAAMS